MRTELGQNSLDFQQNSSSSVRVAFKFTFYLVNLHVLVIGMYGAPYVGLR